MSSKITYRQQYARCGKDRCHKCKEGTGHGPYWYAYWSENGRTNSKYIGIRLPEHIQIKRDSQDRVKAIQAAKYYPETNEITSHDATSSGFLERLPLQLDTQLLRVYVLGQFRVECSRCDEWSAVVDQKWHRRRARALFGCLLSSPGHRLHREQAMKALWPGLDRETAANRLNGAVHELRQILEPELARPAVSRMLRLERNVLELADRTCIWVDADAFESLLNEANTISVQAKSKTSFYQGISNAGQVEQLLEDAAALYNGDYLLEELYSEWAASRRESLQRSWIGLLLNLAELREARGALVSAMEPLNQLLAANPTDEIAVQRLMLLLARLDRRGEALNTYRRLATRLQRNYDSEPLPETHELYEKLRQGRIGKASFPKSLLTIVGGSSQLEEDIAQHPLAKAQTYLPSFGEDISISPAITTLTSTSQFGRHNQSPLIGRTQELDIMRQVLLSIEGASQNLQTANNGHALFDDGLRQRDAKNSHMLLLMGEAGIGKTRLAEELSHEAHKRGWTVAWTRTFEQDGPIPYRSWIELLRELLKNIPTEILISSIGSSSNEETLPSLQYTPSTLERLGTLLPELRAFLPQNALMYPQLPPEHERLHLWEAALELLSAFCKTTSLLLVLDDLHWADGSSRELLAYLARHLQDQRILLLGTCRDGELAPGRGLRTLFADLRREQALVTLAVKPLTRSQIGSLVAHLPQHIVGSIQAQAAGNPFFAEELARVSEAALSLPSHPGDQINGSISRFIEHDEAREYNASPSFGALPESIAAVLERRLERLSSKCQNLLGKAAVLGGSFEFGQLLIMANEYQEDTLFDLLEEALHAGLLAEEGTGACITYHFWHPLIVKHLYDRLPSARCAQLHRRAANSLLQTNEAHEGEVVAAITHHLTKGGGDSEQIVHQLWKHSTEGD